MTLKTTQSGWHGQAYSLARGLSDPKVRSVALASSQACQWCILPTLLLIFLSISCGSPNSANIILRKQNQDLQEQIATLTRAREADAATIRGLQERIGTVPTLSQERLEKLFTTHGIKLGRLTGGADLDLSKPGDEGIKVYVIPFDDDGEPLKAAGSFVIEAFDLAAKTPEIGKWTFDVNAARKAWNGAFLSHQYVLTCPWQKPPQHEELTIKVTFRDELTQREFHVQTVAKVQLPPPTSSTAQAR